LEIKTYFVGFINSSFSWRTKSMKIGSPRIQRVILLRPYDLLVWNHLLPNRLTMSIHTWWLLYQKCNAHTTCDVPVFFISDNIFKSSSWRGVLDTTLCDKACQWFTTDQWFLQVFFTNKTNCHDITDIFGVKHHNPYPPPTLGTSINNIQLLTALLWIFGSFNPLA
jgi:hypothetical protein